VFITQRSEDIETVAPVDVLRRVGCQVELASVSAGKGKLLQLSNGTRIEVDSVFEELDPAVIMGEYDAIVLPGGPGVETLCEADAFLDFVKAYYQSGKLVAAMCAAPKLLSVKSIAQGSRLTSHFSVKDFLTQYEYSEARVVADKNLITSRGPGSALEFGFAIAEYLLQGKLSPDFYSFFYAHPAQLPQP